MAIDGRAARAVPHDRIRGSTSETRSAGSRPKRTAVSGRRGADKRHQPPVPGAGRVRSGGRRAEQRHQRARRDAARPGRPARRRPWRQQAFDQHLRHEPRREAPRAIRRDLPPAGAGAREHERREIAAGDEEHQHVRPNSSDNDAACASRSRLTPRPAGTTPNRRRRYPATRSAS